MTLRLRIAKGEATPTVQEVENRAFTLYLNFTAEAILLYYFMRRFMAIDRTK